MLMRKQQENCQEQQLVAERVYMSMQNNERFKQKDLEMLIQGSRTYLIATTMIQ